MTNGWLDTNNVNFGNRLDNSLETFYTPSTVYADLANIVKIAIQNTSKINNYDKETNSNLVKLGREIIDNKLLSDKIFYCIVDWEIDDIAALDFLLKAGATVHIISCYSDGMDLNKWFNVFNTLKNNYDLKLYYSIEDKIDSHVNISAIEEQFKNTNDTWKPIYNHVTELLKKKTTQTGPKTGGRKSRKHRKFKNTKTKNFKPKKKRRTKKHHKLQKRKSRKHHKKSRK